MKKVWATVLTAALVFFTIFPVGAAAKSVSEIYEYSSSPYVFWVTENYDRNNTKTRLAKSAGLPECFDLRNVGGISFVNEIKNQGNTNSCWAFTSLSCLETFLRRKACENGDSSADYDFSERHMEHATYPNMLDGTNPYAPTCRSANAGGNVISAAGYFQNGLGPVSESDMPFENKADVLSRADIQIAPAAAVRSMRYFPKFTSSIFDYNYHELIAGIKEEIYRGGGVSAVMNTNAGVYNEDGTAYYSAERTGTANHAITLVGWDDNFNRENFGADKPDGDGAWIVRDSAGPNAHDGGYFYLSYENLDTYNMCFAVTGAEDSVFYDNIYSITSGTWAYGLGYENNGDAAYAANTYKKQNTPELLTDVGLSVRGYTEYEIYVNSENSDLSPENLIPAAKGTESHMGFVTVTLPEPVLLSGTEFAIVIKYVTPGYSYSVPVSIPPFCPEIPQGSSFLSPDGENWEDTSLSDCVVGIYGYTEDCTDKSAVSFTKPQAAYVTVYDEEGSPVRPKADGSYALAAGTYRYFAEEQTLGLAEGTFTADGSLPINIEILNTDFVKQPDSDLPYVKMKEVAFRANVEPAEYATLTLNMGNADSFKIYYEDASGERVLINDAFLTVEAGGRVRLSSEFLAPFIENGAEGLPLSVAFFDSGGNEVLTDTCRIVFTKSAFGNVYSAIANVIYNPTQSIDEIYVEHFIKQNLAAGGQVHMNQYDVVYPSKTQNGYLICDILVLDAFSGRFYQFQFDGEIPRVLQEVTLKNGNYLVRVRNNAEGICTVNVFAEYSESGQLLSVTSKNVALIESSFSYPDKGNRVKIFVLSAEDFITPYAPMFDSSAVK